MHAIPKFVLLATVLLSLTETTYGQKSRFAQLDIGLQIDFSGGYIFSDLHVGMRIAIRTEIGLHYSPWFDEEFLKTGFSLVPELTLEPRWKLHHGAFLSMRSTWRPDTFQISNQDERQVGKGFSLTPMLGMHRSFGDHWHIEAGLGLRYQYREFSQFNRWTTCEITRPQVIRPHLHMRVGYRF